jgi:hypothetical protein
MFPCRWPGFSLRIVDMRFVVDKMALGRFMLQVEYFAFTLLPFH